MIRLGLRFHRWALLLIGAGTGLIGALQAAGFYAIAGSTTAARHAFATQMTALGAQISYIVPMPQQLDTVAGYVQWRAYGFAPVLYAAWALAAATGLSRGEEERGIVEHWLAAGLSRAALVWQRSAAFALALAAALGIMTVMTWLAVLPAGGGLPLPALLADALALWALTLSCFGIALLVSQQASTRRSAAGSGGLLLAMLFFLNSLSRQGTQLRPYRWLSPFYYEEKTQALLSGGQLDPGATAVLLLVAAAVIVLAAFAFRWRDLGASLWQRAPRVGKPIQRASRNPLLEVLVLPGLYEQRVGLFFWVVGVAVGGVFTVQIVKPMVDAIPSIPALSAYLGGVTQNAAQAFIGVVWFGLAQLLAAAFAITQVARWAGDDTEGRLEMILSQGVSRRRLILERALALLLAEAMLAVAAGASSYFAAKGIGISLDGRRVVLASALLVLKGLAFGLVGSMLASFRPRLTVAVLSVFAVTGYLLVQFVPLFRWPDWVGYLSFFKLYGTPLSNGLYTQGFEIMLAVVVAGFAISLAAIERRDLAR